MTGRIIYACATLLLVCAPLFGQTTRPIFILRRDVVEAQLRFERIYAAHRPTGDQHAQISRECDRAAACVLNNQGEAAIEIWDRLGAILDPGPLRKLDGLAVRVVPPVSPTTRPGLLRLRVSPLYSNALAAPMELHLRLRSETGDGQAVLDESFLLAPGSAPYSAIVAQPHVPAGRYVIELVGPAGAVRDAGRWAVLDTLPARQWLINDRRMASLRVDSERTLQSMAACHARNALLVEPNEDSNPARFLADSRDLARDVTAETEALITGKDPYIDRVGLLWRTIVCGTMEVPCMIYAPKVAPAHQPMPLLIALHDLTGDENAMLDVLAGARLQKLADDAGVVVVTPGVAYVERNLAALDALTATLSSLYTIDPKRVFVMGHGTGALAALEMAQRQPDRVARLVLLGAADFSQAAHLPPTLLIAGGADGLFAPETAQAALRQAQSRKLPVELNVIDDAGHSLLFDDGAETAMKWLMH